MIDKMADKISAPAIKIEQIHKSFGNLHALNGIDLTIHQGEFFGLLGPNGAGKSTLINILAGLLKPTRGKVSIMGHDVINAYQAARMSLGVVPQELVFDPFLMYAKCYVFRRATLVVAKKTMLG